MHSMHTMTYAYDIVCLHFNMTPPGDMRYDHIHVSPTDYKIL